MSEQMYGDTLKFFADWQKTKNVPVLTFKGSFQIWRSYH